MKGIARYIFGIALSAALSFGAAQSAYCQDYVNTPVEISKEKVKIDGKICYSHIVLEKQTLYSISKAYEVSIDDIYRFNPSVKENGLKKNSIIIIPSHEALKSDSGKNDTAAQKVAKTENSVKEEVKVADPQKPAAEKSEKKAKQDAQRIHVAKWYEDLDVISETYGVSVEEIMAANNLTGRKLGKRQKLIIPYPGETVEKPAEQTFVEKVVEIAQDIKAEIEDTIVAIIPKSEVSATIVLPLTNENGEANRNNMDFYCGALLAVYDLANNGVDCKLNVFDINGGKSYPTIDNLSNSDFIIGPVSSADLTRTLNTVSDNIPVVSPLDPRAEKLITGHSSLIQVPAPQAAQYRDLVAWMEEEYNKGDQAIMITEKGARQTAITTVIKEALDSSSLAYKNFAYSILEGRDVTEPLTALMTSEGKNRIIIASESEAFVNDVVRNLNLLIYNNIDLVAYAPSKIRGFETIEVENLHNTSMRVSLSYYIDYETPEVKEFLMKYRSLYNTEPNQFAFQGYDVTRYLVDLCSKYGKNWVKHIERNDANMLQSTFNIRKQTIGGYQNYGIRRIVYENGYSVRKVK